MATYLRWLPHNWAVGFSEGTIPLVAKGWPWHIGGEDVYSIAEHDKPRS